jgi:hypothetical protein
MAVRVKLDDITAGLESQSSESSSFLDKRTGEIALVNDYEMQVAEDNEPIDDLPEWEQDLVRSAREILADTDNYIQLPSQFDIDEYSIMEDFCYSLDDPKLRDTLLDLITGSGAFRRFKDAAHEHNIADKWYDFRNSEFRQIAIDWCKENDIQFDE